MSVQRDIWLKRAGLVKEEKLEELTMNPNAGKYNNAHIHYIPGKAPGEKPRPTAHIHPVQDLRSPVPGKKPVYSEKPKNYSAEEVEQNLEENTDYDKHFDDGYEHGRAAANDAGFKEKARSIKKDMLADNPHKKGTPEHKAWHEGASEGHQDALDLDM